MTLVIGCGHPDRGDDAAGLLVARRLRSLGLNAVEHSGDGLALIELWGGSEDVVLVDAMLGGSSPGTVLVWDPVADPVCARNLCCSTHAFGPAEAIELARIVGRFPRRIRIYGIEAASFNPGGELTAPVREAAGRVIQEIAQRSGCDFLGALAPDRCVSSPTRALPDVGELLSCTPALPPTRTFDGT